MGVHETVFDQNSERKNKFKGNKIIHKVKSYLNMVPVPLKLLKKMYLNINILNLFLQNISYKSAIKLFVIFQIQLQRDLISIAYNYSF